MHRQRPLVTAIAAMSADGKIADYSGAPARFPSAQDKAHLERLIAQVDAVMFGANTLRAYGTSLPIGDRHLLQQRQDRHQPPQPIHFVCSGSGNLSQDLPFFRQPLRRGLLTAPEQLPRWAKFPGFEQIIALDPAGAWLPTLTELRQRGIEKLGLLGGGNLIASFAEQGCLDELWLTVCPVLLGGTATPTPMAGHGFLQTAGLTLELLEYEAIASELFLHYRVKQ
ncbi:RibD family protein [Picosynechococcus sp. NKBG042902]|uniref:RibD family protein n=1 Tax=Picosynechococcus sp. NKBG042902 TaxID=490193 RepID=UPI0004A9DD96|nr:RibD family protein [Picosynechococcus sp. NKBG042902]